ncbi:hypothetical protein AB0937_03230 [Streptomyces sp. NPDC047880]|uniref:hypothetical protein n=1 Tax=Streptomyces sp. NPDC047880 TaxID=3155626 RepID=UPI0034568581
MRDQAPAGLETQRGGAASGGAAEISAGPRAASAIPSIYTKTATSSIRAKTPNGYRR